MNNIWEQLSEEDRIFLRKSYQEMKEVSNKNKYLYDNMLEDQEKRLEGIFGKENLNPEPQIKTWEDIENLYPSYKVWMDGFIAFCLDNRYIGDNKISNRLIAAIKIAKLIEECYGGMITDEEWRNCTIPKYYIWYNNMYNTLVRDNTYAAKEFIAFHTEEQCDEFFKNNEQLCKDYYMIKEK